MVINRPTSPLATHLLLLALFDQGVEVDLHELVRGQGQHHGQNSSERNN